MNTYSVTPIDSPNWSISLDTPLMMVVAGILGVLIWFAPFWFIGAILLVRRITKRDTHKTTLIVTILAVIFGLCMFVYDLNRTDFFYLGLFSFIQAVLFGCLVWILLWAPSVLIPHFLDKRRQTSKV